MTLREYLAAPETTASHRQFAERIGVSSAAVWRYVHGERIPDKDIMARIALATGGKVTANDFYAAAA
jgi:transcriptional regulator with XRE-family HTH domain